MARLQALLASLLLPAAALGAAVPQRASALGQGTFGTGGFNIANAGSPDAIPNSYIVVYNSTFGDEAIDALQFQTMDHIKKRNLNKRGLNGQPLSTEVHTVAMDGWRAMSLESDDSMIQEIMAEPGVAWVEQNAKVQLSATVAQMNAPPGLVRLSNGAPATGNYVFDTTGGQGITVYVVDTGVRVDHSEFQGRATLGVNTVDNSVRPPASSPLPYQSSQLTRSVAR